jgi:hypothetical protein
MIDAWEKKKKRIRKKKKQAQSTYTCIYLEGGTYGGGYVSISISKKNAKKRDVRRIPSFSAVLLIEKIPNPNLDPKLDPIPNCNR